MQFSRHLMHSNGLALEAQVLDWRRRSWTGGEGLGLEAKVLDWRQRSWTGGKVIGLKANVLDWRQRSWKKSKPKSFAETGHTEGKVSVKHRRYFATSHQRCPRPPCPTPPLSESLSNDCRRIRNCKTKIILKCADAWAAGCRGFANAGAMSLDHSDVEVLSLRVSVHHFFERHGLLDAKTQLFLC